MTIRSECDPEEELHRESTQSRLKDLAVSIGILTTDAPLARQMQFDSLMVSQTRIV